MSVCEEFDLQHFHLDSIKFVGNDFEDPEHEIEIVLQLGFCYQALQMSRIETLVM